MAKVKNLNELETINANSAKILAMSPNSEVGYIGNVFNDSGKINEVVELEKAVEQYKAEHAAKAEEVRQQLQNAIDVLESAKEQINQKIEEHESKITANQGNIDSNKQKIEAIELDVEERIDAELGSLKEKDTELDNKIDTVGDKADSLEETVNAHDAKLTGINNTISSLTNLANNNSTSIADIKTDIQSVQSDITGVKSDIEDYESLLADLTEKCDDIESIKSDVEQLQEASESHATQESVTEIDNKVTTLNSTVQEHEARIQSLEDSAITEDDVTKAIADETTKIDLKLIDKANKSDLTDYVTKEALEDHLADISDIDLDTLKAHLEELESLSGELNENTAAIADITKELGKMGDVNDANTLWGAIYGKASQVAVDEINKDLKELSDKVTNDIETKIEAIDTIKESVLDEVEKTYLKVSDYTSCDCNDESITSKINSILESNYQLSDVLNNLAALTEKIAALEEANKSTESEVEELNASVNNYTAVVKDMMGSTEL